MRLGREGLVASGSPVSFSGCGEWAAEAKQVADGIADLELIHFPLAYGQRRDDGNFVGEEFGVEIGNAGFDVEVSAGRVVFLERRGLYTEMDVRGASMEYGVVVCVVVPSESHCCVEEQRCFQVADWKDGSDAFNLRWCWHGVSAGYWSDMFLRSSFCNSLVE